MKKFTAILMLSVHLFYVGGFTLVFRYMMNQSDQQIVKRIYENKIDKTQLYEIKVPVSLPYVTDWKDYEKIEGQIQLNGTYYNYVRLKMTHDTMSLICIANTEKTKLFKDNVIMAKNLSDVPASKKGQDNGSSVKKAGLDVQYSLELFGYSCQRFGSDFNTTFHQIFSINSSPYIESPGKPPNTIAC